MQYFDKARNNSHHTLWVHLKESLDKEIISDNPETIEVKNNQIIVGSKSGYISELIILEKGTILLKEVKVRENNRIHTYYLPEEHKQKSLYPLDSVLPHMVGKKGVLYYKNLYSNILQKLDL